MTSLLSAAKPDLAGELYRATERMRDGEDIVQQLAAQLRAQRAPSRVGHEIVKRLNRAQQDLELFAAQMRDVEERVQHLLSTLFSAWRGWFYTPAGGIDVYQANHTVEAAQTLHDHGFDTVTLHGHSAARFLSCDCQVSELTQVDPRRPRGV